MLSAVTSFAPGLGFHPLLLAGRTGFIFLVLPGYFFDSPPNLFAILPQSLADAIA